MFCDVRNCCWGMITYMYISKRQSDSPFCEGFIITKLCENITSRKFPNLQYQTPLEECACTFQVDLKLHTL